MTIPLFLGKDVSGRAARSPTWPTMPHCSSPARPARASRCASTRSSCRSCTTAAGQVKLILIDPKVVEMAQFKDIPHLMCPVINDMPQGDERAGVGVREDGRALRVPRRGGRAKHQGLQRARDRGADRATSSPSTPRRKRKIPKKLPYIVIIIDEMADLMMTSRQGSRVAHRPPRPEGPRGRHAPDPGDAEAEATSSPA